MAESRHRRGGRSIGSRWPSGRRKTAHSVRWVAARTNGVPRISAGLEHGSRQVLGGGVRRPLPSHSHRPTDHWSPLSAVPPPLPPRSGVGRRATRGRRGTSSSRSSSSSPTVTSSRTAPGRPPPPRSSVIVLGGRGGGSDVLFGPRTPPRTEVQDHDVSVCLCFVRPVPLIPNLNPDTQSPPTNPPSNTSEGSPASDTIRRHVTRAQAAPPPPPHCEWAPVAHETSTTPPRFKSQT